MVKQKQKRKKAPAAVTRNIYSMYIIKL